jgi:hypothetical protein
MLVIIGRSGGHTIVSVRFVLGIISWFGKRLQMWSTVYKFFRYIPTNSITDDKFCVGDLCFSKCLIP